MPSPGDGAYDAMDGYEWQEITYERPTIPEFIEARAKGEMKMENGKIYRKVLAEDIDSYRDDYWDYNDLPDEETIEKYEDKHGK